MRRNKWIDRLALNWWTWLVEIWTLIPLGCTEGYLNASLALYMTFYWTNTISTTQSKSQGHSCVLPTASPAGGGAVAVCQWMKDIFDLFGFQQDRSILTGTVTVGLSHNQNQITVRDLLHHEHPETQTGHSSSVSHQTCVRCRWKGTIGRNWIWNNLCDIFTSVFHLKHIGSSLWRPPCFFLTVAQTGQTKHLLSFLSEGCHRFSFRFGRGGWGEGNSAATCNVTTRCH